jgi:Na+-transporting NADH:ubiquinone oxidoreductase subunit C
VSANNETLSRVLTVALGLCIVCSVVVSTAAVALKPQQEANKARDLKRNILMAGGLYDPERSVEEQFVSIQPRVVDIDTGVFVDDVDPALFDQRKSAKDPAQSRTLSGAEDSAKILRRENRAVVYLVNDEAGALDRIIFPFAATGCGPHSMGLSPWSPTRTRSWG